MRLEIEERLDPRLTAALARLGMPPRQTPANVAAETLAAMSRAERLAAVREADAELNALYDRLAEDLPEDRPLDYRPLSLEGKKGNLIRARLFPPSRETAAPCPALVYFHGGGMTLLDSFAAIHQRWCQDLADAGLTVLSVDFRNACTADAWHPFPAGLDDCLSGVHWLHAQRESLGISRLVVQGESGGANLALATAMSALRAGESDMIDGIYAAVPYLSGAYDWTAYQKRRSLPSLAANDGIFMDCSLLSFLADTYDPSRRDRQNPLCWPFFAAHADLEGLPPCVVTVSELDPLRDEGISFYRKLLAAGVTARARENLGIFHGAELLFRQAIPDIHFAGVADIAAFARALPAN